MRRIRPAELLDERRHLERAIEALLWTRPVRLREVSAASPGAYALLYTGDAEMYERLRPATSRGRRHEPLVISGGSPIYIGKSRGLQTRMAEHIRNLGLCTDLGADDFLVITLPTPSEGGAVFFESLLTAAYRPVWNEGWLTGFGSKPQGTSRTEHQSVPAWSVLHPGRRVLEERIHGPVRVGLRERVKQHLADGVNDFYTVAYRSLPQRRPST